MNNAHVVRVILPSFSPQAPPSFPPLRGQTSSLAVLLSNLGKIGSIFSERPGFPAARADFVRDFDGDGLGRAKQEDGRDEWENLLGKTLFFGIFRTSFNCSGAPEGERMRGWAGDGLGALNVKKKTQEREFLGPLGVII